jgi:hypothetical protein
MKSPVVTRRLAVACCAAAACLAARSVQAVSLWYDPFEVAPGQYTLGSAAGQSGGAGTFFTGPWLQPGGDDQLILADSLTKPGLGTLPLGGALGDNDVAGCCITGRVGKQFTTPWHGRTPPEGTFYIGFLANYGTTQDPTQNPHHRTLEMWDSGGVASGMNDDNRNLMLGYSTFAGLSDHLSMMVKDTASGQQLVKPLSENLAFADDGDTHCLVLRFDLTNVAGGDKVAVYLDPMGLTEPATPSAAFAAADYTSGGLDVLLDSMGGIVQFSFTGVETAARMDDLRVGTAFADVACMLVPEPAAVSLMGFAVVGLAAAYRRK